MISAEKKAYNKIYRLNNLEKIRESNKKWVKDNKAHVIKSQKERYNKIKLEVMSYYSKGTPKCKCCGIEPLIFLSIDHINGGGNEHRKKIRKGKSGGGGTHMYYWLKKNNYPTGFRVLCFNCNFAKYHLKKCPHKL